MNKAEAGRARVRARGTGLRQLAALVVLTVNVPSSPAAANDLSFTDITRSSGVGGPTGAGRTGGHGVMFADVDGDGRPDLYITMIWEVPMADLFFHNEGGNVFSDAGKSRGLADFDGGSHGACFADLDNDGDYDLFNGTTWDHAEYPAVNNIYRNDGKGVFVDVTASSGVPLDRRWPTRGVLTLDMDADGDLDLFCVTNYQGSRDPPGELNEAYLNEDDLHFRPVHSGALLTAPCGQGATDTDFDGDGDIDILAANRTGDVNILRNDGRGSFSRVTPASIGIHHRAADGVTVGDVDNDGDLDLLLAGNDEAHLYLNEGKGTFRPVRSFTDTDGYMGGFADLDHDGDLDLVFAGDDKVYLGDGHGRFVDGPKVPVSGIDDPRGIAFADTDGDGDLDFSIGCKRSRNWLVRNDGSHQNWLKVRLVSPRGQAGAFGAKVTLYSTAQAGSRLLGFRESRSQNGYLGQDDPVLHFGLGSRGSVVVAVDFLDGSRMEVLDVRANQTVTIDGRDHGTKGKTEEDKTSS